ncbi:hypothetical protein CPB84DRAFT_1752550 [Gymnopilus junonius]|uniref:Uncharacterized protein n=1 Tax=Gymnopilus junonius TaxID=109634 RepID=A0A9P5N972_GYMJU|nr:hypothetical protein CPB84DRAFT_1752550 [Gymnopilus junonius]
MSEIAVCAGQFGAEGKDVDTSSSTSFRGQRFITGKQHAQLSFTAFPITPPTNNKQLTLSSISISATPSHSRLPSKINMKSSMLSCLLQTMSCDASTWLRAFDCPCKFMATPITEVEASKFRRVLMQLQLLLPGLSPELPTEIPGVGNLAFFKAEDAQYFANILKEENQE